jgi:hypothetical protein
MERASPEWTSQGEAGSTSQAQNICALYLGNGAYRSQARLNQSHNYDSLPGINLPLYWDKNVYSFLQNVANQNHCSLLIREVTPLPITDANHIPTLTFNLLIFPQRKCYQPCFTDEESKIKQST